MSNNQPYDPQQDSTGNPQPTDWRALRREEREQRRENRRSRYGSSGAWIGGAVLILIGGVLLLQNFGIALENWWALFILIPALGALSAAWSEYQNAGGRLTIAARGSLIGGLFMLILTAVFLFGITSNLFWPVILILAGLGILLNAFLPG